jgi:retron-type reverse transcriptase
MPTQVTSGSPKGTYKFLRIIVYNAMRPSRGGDGGVIVRKDGRTPALGLQERALGFLLGSFLKVKTPKSKLGYSTVVKRGNDTKISPYKELISIKKIYNMKNLATAYKMIKSNTGNLRRVGMDNTYRLNEISIKILQKLQQNLKAEKFRFTPARIILKSGKSETRQLTLISFLDKVVEKAIQLVLEQRYENLFLETSHGFRLGRGTKTAIRYIYENFKSVHYIIEAGFTKAAFGATQHSKLLEILRENIKCEKTINLIKFGLKAGHIKFGELHQNLDIVLREESVLSPLLCNIYLDKLDIFMESIKAEYNRGSKLPANPEYDALLSKAKY